MNSNTKAAAILLCAGKGTRMGETDRSKVCYDCAGVPVIKRILSNMRKGGVSRFVIVVGHKAESVMSVLDGEPGVLYAYQKDQKGTGHATACGLRALDDIGYSGPVIVSMGDKIISPDTIRRILNDNSMKSLCVCGVQRKEEHPNGGHVMVVGGNAIGIVEYADVKKALAQNAQIELCGQHFSAAEVAATPWVNAALYRFDSTALGKALASCSADNAQGEIYLTDTIEHFAAQGEVSLYKVEHPNEMLTYSTKVELRNISRCFLRKMSELKADHPEHAALINSFIERYGDRLGIIARAPGRVNLMGRHIEHRGGSVNVMAVEFATVMVASPRDDDVIHVSNVVRSYPEGEFHIGQPSAVRGGTDAWLKWLSDENVRKELDASRGSWINYVKGIAYRLRDELDFQLSGMDVMVGGDIPVAAGLSSSSALVVATAEAITSLNCLNMTDRQFVDLCGEGEWFVGSRGGAGDHAAMRCSKPDKITHLEFKPFSIGRSVSFPENLSVIVANSLEQSKKSEGSRDKFNARIAAYEFALLLLKRLFPDKPLVVFRDLVSCGTYEEIKGMLASIPPKITRAALSAMLPESKEKLAELFSTHADPGEYDLYGTALFGVSEIARAALVPDILDSGDGERLGELMKISHDGDRVTGTPYAIENHDGELAYECGSYACSTYRIDALCDLMNSTEGVLGSELSGAGLGGCVLILVEKDKTESVMDRLNRDFYDKLNLPRSAFVCRPADGSKVFY